mgnify:CR=1 FL=1
MYDGGFHCTKSNFMETAMFVAPFSIRSESVSAMRTLMTVSYTHLTLPTKRIV